MPANTAPIFSRLANLGFSSAVPVLAANITTDLTAGTIYLVWTADATNGGYLDKLIFQALGTNVATVARIWINNGGSTAVALNNSQIADVTLPATTVSQVAGIGSTTVPIGFALPLGYRVYVTLGTVVAAGFDVTAVGGSY